MSTGPTGSADRADPDRPGDSAAESSSSRRWLPFWVLQAAELAVAFVFVDVAVHLSSEVLLLAGAALLALLALTARGPLGIVRLCPRQLHAVLVVVASAAIALAPILPVLRPDLAGIVVVEFAAVGLVRLATLTRTAEPAVRAEDRAPAVPTVPTTGAPAVPTVPTVPTTGAPAADGPAQDERDVSRPSVAEQSGRAAAAATLAGQRAVERYGPVAEDQTRRALRGAGRSVGRMLRRVSPPTEPPH